MASTSSETPSLSLSSSSSSIPGSNYDVFLSFRGEDTRHSFTDHLYVAFRSKGIEAFRDSEKLQLGQEIGSELIQAIEKSQYAIVVFSEKYADSRWCLDELAKIVECRKNKGLKVVPVFYRVDPSNVRKQTGPFGKAFAEHNKDDRIDGKKIQKWKDALTEVGNLSGEHIILHQSSEAKVIQNIVQWVSNNLSYKIETNELVGISSRTEDLKLHLALESNDVRFIGIWGMGGMGKTTLAKFVYYKFSDQFEASSFIHDVRTKSENGLHGLQRTLLKKLLGVDMDIEDADWGVCIIKKRLHCKKILLILDDVNDLKQLEKLAGGHNWFGPGSRIIITTRNKSLLEARGVKEIYEFKELNDGEALELFSLKAFGKGHPDVDYMELSQDFVRYSQGLPLALELLGSPLFKKNKGFWKCFLDRVKKSPESGINKVLKISYEELEPLEKEIFLNISCFFCGNDQDCVFKILDYLELVPAYGLEVLKGKALIKLQDNQLWMHDLLKEMGRNIVFQESDIPLRRSRLWLYTDIEEALGRNEETEEIKGIVLQLFNPKVAHWNLESFSKMHCLKTLIIDNVDLKNDLKYLPSGLRFLDWSGYPSKLFPSSFRAKSFERLKAIQLNKSPKLIKTPDFTDFPVLEELELKDCINLLALHPSIGVHKKLILLNLKGCKNLKSLPRMLEMESLEILILSECSKVKSIPEFGENMKSASEFYLDGTAITKLPTSIGNLTGLVLLNVKDCKNLMTLPSTFLNLNSLEKLNFSGCSKLLKILGATESLEGFYETGMVKKLFNRGVKQLFNRGVKRKRTNPLDLSITSLSSLCSLSKLETLDSSYCNLNAIPNAIGCFSTLKFLILSGNNFGSFMQGSPDPLEMLLTSLSEGSCSLNKLDLSYCNLNGLSDRIGCLPSLKELILSGNKFGYLPESIAQLINLLSLHLKDCPSLRSLPMLPQMESMPSLFSVLESSGIFKPDCPDILGVGDYTSIVHMMKESWMALTIHKCFFASIYRRSLSAQDVRHTNAFGSEIPEWFELQNIGAEINIKVPSHLCDELAGIASCGFIRSSFLTHFPGICKRYVGNGFTKFGIRYRAHGSGMEVKECGIHLLYQKDVESFQENRNRIKAERKKKAIEETRAERYERRKEQREKDIAEIKRLRAESQRSNNSIILYEGSDDCDGAGPSGEGSSNDVPHPKQIERLPELAHGDSDSEGSLEYFDWGASSESDLEESPAERTEREDKEWEEDIAEIKRLMAKRQKQQQHHSL
ncbi:disease resistance protein RUN1-like [Quercus robur]|uniref:disease resistance protein RUN1-like n=1 Tax=Quercus robur TaxID=38942 RepID=UPI0021620738|nr:disease resistance protein RUN1-like [Quercus robur]